MATISKYSSFVFDEDNHRKDRQLKYIQPFLSKDSIKKCAVGVLTNYQNLSLEDRITVKIFNDITGEEVEAIMPKGGFEVDGGLYAITFEFDETAYDWDFLQPFVRHRVEVREWDLLVGKAYFLHYGSAKGCIDGVVELSYKPTIINDLIKSNNNETGYLKDDEFVFMCDDNGNVKPVVFSCIGGFDKRASSFHSKIETFRDAGYNLNFLSGFNSETNRLFFGDEYGVPNDVGKKLSLIMSCDNVSVYNLNNKHSPTEIILSDSSDIERIELCEDYPFFVFAVSVEQRNHRQYTYNV